MPILLPAFVFLFLLLSHEVFTTADAASITADKVNLAVVATPSTSYVSGHETLSAVNDGFTPKHSDDKSKGAYGNWPRNGIQWVQYDWNQSISTDRIELYWFDDRKGVRLPKACRLMTWNGKEFVQVPGAKGLGLKEHQFNVTTFPELVTSRLRLEMDSNRRSSTGILEWRVCDSGNSPDFPPVVNAGVDRVVVQGGRTFLEGNVQTLKPASSKVRLQWSKASGPGKVSFDDEGKSSTTATFSKPGNYKLKFTVKVGKLSGKDTIDVKVEPPPPATCLEPIHTVQNQITSPFWCNRLKGLIVNWIPHCIEKISDPDLKEGGINNFVDAANKLAGKPHGRHRGYSFANAWVYNTIEAMCLAIMSDAQADKAIIEAQNYMRATLEDWIPQILAAQEHDGYLQTAFTLADNKPHWSPRHRGDHEGYVAGYFLEAALVHHLMTRGQDQRLYAAAKKLADCWHNNIGPAPKQRWWDGHQAIEMALVRFGRYVNQVEGSNSGRKYIELAKFLLDCREEGSPYDQSHVPVIQQYEAVGHAVRASYSYAGMADVALEFGDLDYISAVQSLWDNLVHRKYYVTGGIGSGETAEGFGPDYSLRHNAYCESCSSSGTIFFQQRLNRLHHEARYADLLEETLYNALLGAMDLEGRNFYYQNPLNESRKRYSWHGCPCCVGNIPRTLLSLPTWAYLKSDDAVYVNLFIGSKVVVENIAGTDVQMVQTTDYPWSGKVSIEINPTKPKRFMVNVRIPTRDVSDLYSAVPKVIGLEFLAINGTAVQPKVTNGYAVHNREWKAGDRIELSLPLPVQRIKASPKIESTRGRIALRRGPLIYSFESENQDLESVLPPDADLLTEWKPNLLDGVMVIKGTFANGRPMQAIPNYARQNRGGSSVVWIRNR